MRVIKLAHLRDVIELIDKEEISMSKAADILNDIVLNAERQELIEMHKLVLSLQECVISLQREIIKLKLVGHEGSKGI